VYVVFTPVFHTCFVGLHSMAALGRLHLPLEVLTCVCQYLELRDLVCVAETCKRLRLGDGGMETAELPTKSPVVMALRALAFPGGCLMPSTRPTGCSESWLVYLARCVRQRRCREAPPIAARYEHTLFVDATGQVLVSNKVTAVGHGDARGEIFVPNLVAAMTEVRLRSVAAEYSHYLALRRDGQVYSWGENNRGQLGQGDTLTKRAPALVEGLEGVRGMAVAFARSFAVTQSGDVYRWGEALLSGSANALRPIIVEGLVGVRVRQVCAGACTAFAIGEAGELFSWGRGEGRRLGHGDEQDQPSPKLVEALRGVRMSDVSTGAWHALALSEDGLVYAWDDNTDRAILSNPRVKRELLPKPIKALQDVRAGSVAVSSVQNFAVTDTGELWAWGSDGPGLTPLGYGEQEPCALPKPIESLRGIKVDAVAAEHCHVLALADDGSVYAWGNAGAATSGELGLGPSVSVARMPVLTPQRTPALRVSCGL
jgi:alpha-tubulin suppressor-like RCC1 family protein